MVPKISKVVARIQLFPYKEWLNAEIKVTIKNVNSQELEFILAVRVPESTGKFEVKEVTQENRLCKFRLKYDRLIVMPAKSTKETEFKIIYEGKPRQDQDDFIRKDELVLRMDGAWLPILPSTYAEFEVLIEHPADYSLFGQGIREGPESIDGKRAISKWYLKGANGFTLYGAPEYKILKTTVGENEIITAVWPRDIHLLDDLSQITTEMMRRLTHELGPYPYPIVRIVESGRWDGRSGYGAISNISIGYRKIREGIDKVMIAHELSHGWWGGIIPVSHEALFKGQWNETLAEYTSSWALNTNEAEKLRNKWSLGYASLDRKSESPILEIGSYSATNWKINEAVTYFKGALLLTSLEDRIGLDSIRRLLQYFINKRSGKPSTWEHLLRAIGEICGEETVLWIQNWLNSNTAPELKLTEVTHHNEVVTGHLLQIANPLFNGKVEIGFYNNDTLLGIKWISFKEEETSFEFKIPNDINRLIIDPRKRMPRRYDPVSDPKILGLEVKI